MNVRKAIDYSKLFEAVDKAVRAAADGAVLGNRPADL